MREYTKKPENQSHTLDSNHRASRQAPISEILQAYKNDTLGKQPVQREGIEDEDLLQTKRSGQAPASVILQRYKESIQRYVPEEDEPLQGKFDTAQREKTDEDELLQGKIESASITKKKTIQRGEKSNNTGLPDNLKTGIESLSGYSMDNIKVYYNSEKPTQLNALAYAQGTDIHIAPGQEKHLPHEAWHIVQQKQDRIQPTMQLQGVNVNDNEELEKEADVMGREAKAVVQQKAPSKSSLFSGAETKNTKIIQRQRTEKEINIDKNNLRLDAMRIRNRLFDYGYAAEGDDYSKETDLLKLAKSYANIKEIQRFEKDLRRWAEINANLINLLGDDYDNDKRYGQSLRLEKIFYSIAAFVNKNRMELGAIRKKQLDILTEDERFRLEDKLLIQKVLSGKAIEAMPKQDFVDYAIAEILKIKDQDAEKREKQNEIATFYKEAVQEKPYDQIPKEAIDIIRYLINYYKTLIEVYGHKNVFKAASELNIREANKSAQIREKIQTENRISYHPYDQQEAKSVVTGSLQDFARTAKERIDDLIAVNPPLKKDSGDKGEKTKASMQLLENGKVLDDLNYAVFVSGAQKTSDFIYSGGKRTQQGLSGDDSLAALTYSTGCEEHIHERNNDTEVKILERTLRFLKDNVSKDPSKMELRVFVSRYTCPSCSDLFYKAKQKHEELNKLGSIKIVYTENAF